jgi:hypothetical protein
VILKPQHEHVFDVAARWVQSDEMLTGPLRLIGDFGPEAMPPGIPDRLRRAAVLLHRLDLQRPDDDRLVFVNQSSSQLVLEIASAAGDSFMRRCEAVP